MSAIGILRSFAEARCADHEPIPARLTYGTIREVLRIIEEWERSARKPTNETTPDAVELLSALLGEMLDGLVVPPTEAIERRERLYRARNALLAERARHAEEVARLRDVHLDETRALDDLRLKEIASLRDQLRRTEGARDVATRVAADHFGTICQLRDQLRKVEGERDTLAVRMDLPASQLLMVGSELCGDGKIDPNDHRDPRWTPTLQRAAEVMRELTARRSLLPDVRACAEWMRDELIEGHELQTLGCRILAALDSQGGEGE